MRVGSRWSGACWPIGDAKAMLGHRQQRHADIKVKRPVANKTGSL
jgi:hypothetical protein